MLKTTLGTAILIIASSQSFGAGSSNEGGGNGVDPIVLSGATENLVPSGTDSNSTDSNGFGSSIRPSSLLAGGSANGATGNGSGASGFGIQGEKNGGSVS